MFEDEKLRLIDSLPERDTIQYIWTRLLAQAGKTNANGFIYLTENMPYTEEMLSLIFNRPVNSIRLALDTLCKFSMIKIEADMTIKIINWEKHQNVEGMDRIREQSKKRVANSRDKQKCDKSQWKDEGNFSVKQCNVTENVCNVTVTQQKESKNKIEKEELDKELDIERERKRDRKNQFLESEEELGGIKESSFKVLDYYERITGIVGVFSLGALNIAIEQYGEAYVCKAIDKSLEVNKANITYVNGILKNWERERDLPKEFKSYDEKFMFSNCNEFEGFT
jgi:predicted phage replisome organizer